MSLDYDVMELMSVRTQELYRLNSELNRERSLWWMQEHGMARANVLPEKPSFSHYIDDLFTVTNYFCWEPVFEPSDN